MQLDNRQLRQLDFATLVKHLEQLVVKLEREDLSLESALTTFETGIHLAAEGKLRLEAAEKKIAILLPTQGKETLAAFDADANERSIASAQDAANV